MQILQRQLQVGGVAQRTRGVTLEDLSREHFAAVVMNSWTPSITISYLGGHRLAQDPAFEDVLRRAYESEPLTHI